MRACFVFCTCCVFVFPSLLKCFPPDFHTWTQCWLFFRVQSLDFVRYFSRCPLRILETALLGSPDSTLQPLWSRDVVQVSGNSFSTWENKTTLSPAFRVPHWPGVTITSLELVGWRTCPCSSEPNTRPSPLTRLCVIDICDERSVTVPLFLQFSKTNLIRGSVKGWVCDTTSSQRDESTRFALKFEFSEVAVRAFQGGQSLSLLARFYTLSNQEFNC